jgi:hypothetical protein
MLPRYNSGWLIKSLMADLIMADFFYSTIHYSTATRFPAYIADG